MTTTLDPQDVRTWTPTLLALRYDYYLRRVEEQKIVDRVNAGLLNKGPAIPISDWVTLLDAGFPGQLIDIVCDGCVRAEELDSDDVDVPEGEESPKQQKFTEIVIELLSLLGILEQTLKHTSHCLATYPDPNHAQQILHALLTKWTTLMGVMWDAAYTFFISETNANACQAATAFPDKVIRCYGYVDTLTVETTNRRNVSTKITRDCQFSSAKVLGTLWLHSMRMNGRERVLPPGSLEMNSAMQLINNKVASRETALHHLCNILTRRAEEATKTPIKNFDDVFREMTKDPRVATREMLYMACVNDLVRGWNYLDSTYPHLCDMAAFFCVRSTMPARTSIQRGLLSTAMGACRRQLCSWYSDTGTDSERASYHLNCLVYMHSFINVVAKRKVQNSGDAYKTKPWAPELWVHEMLQIHGEVARKVWAEGPWEPLGVRYVVQTIQELGRMLRYYLHNPSRTDSPHWIERFPPSRAVRLFSLHNWENVRKNLIDLGVLAHRKKRILYTAWNGLGETLREGVELSSNATPTQEWDLPPLKRCACGKCLCNVFQATHAMRPCRCLKVAYCNKYCQKNDWESHKTSCTAMLLPSKAALRASSGKPSLKVRMNITRV